MSPQLNHYVVYGANLPYKRFTEIQEKIISLYTDSAFEISTNPKDGLTILDDGMSGTYIIIGVVIAKTENHQGFDEPIEITGIPPEYDRAALFKLINDLDYDATEVKYKYIVVSYYR
jgi:hypothetical protein